MSENGHIGEKRERWPEVAEVRREGCRCVGGKRRRRRNSEDTGGRKKRFPGGCKIAMIESVLRHRRFFRLYKLNVPTVLPYPGVWIDQFVSCTHDHTHRVCYKHSGVFSLGRLSQAGGSWKSSTAAGECS